jgi:hypothetical protein
MANQRRLVMAGTLALWASGAALALCSAADDRQNPSPAQSPLDAIADAQTPQQVPAERPEQKKTEHDLSDIFAPSKARPTTSALSNQTDGGQFLGFDLL